MVKNNLNVHKKIKLTLHLYNNTTIIKSTGMEQKLNSHLKKKLVHTIIRQKPNLHSSW